MEAYLKEYIAMWKNWSDFEGKAGLRDLWMAVLINFVVTLLLSLIGIGIIYQIYSLAILIPMIALGIRRFHDIGKSGWNYLWFFLPIIGWIIVIYFWIQPSK